jgi:16S rRNA (cytosine967-C5)-methyltransferase
MGLYQIMFMDSVPDSAAVNETVALAPKRAKGYVNAILRNHLRADNDYLNKAGLSVKYSCPQWLIDKWQAEYGDEAALQILQTSLDKPPIFERNGYVQDKSSYDACELLNPQPNDIVLDLCAAPGGKSFTVARIMHNTGCIISCDINKNKLNLLKKTSEQLGLSIIQTCVNNAKEFNADFPKADKVLCDVPCSGLGVIRRKPEIKYKSEEEFAGLPQIQSQILQTSAAYVKVGGVLMYSTCTLSRAENDGVIDTFIASANGFELIEKRTTIPQKDGGDGFFVAYFRRVGAGDYS